MAITTGRSASCMGRRRTSLRSGTRQLGAHRVDGGLVVLVGEDGATHHGVFDIPFLRCIPNMMIAAPSNEVQLRNLLYTVQKELKGPIAIRYPRGRGVIPNWQQEFQVMEYGKGSRIKEGFDLVVMSLGNTAENVKNAINILPDPTRVAHYDAVFVKPLDEEMFHDIFNNFARIVTVEDGAVTGGFGTAVLEFAANHSYSAQIKCLGVPDVFIEQGSVDELYEIANISVESISLTIQGMLE